MKKSSLLLLFLLPVALRADPAVDRTSLRDGAALRRDMAAAVHKGDETPEAALARLRAHPAPNGLKGDADADLGYAALDVGLRLLPGDPARAAIFFRAAEQALVKAVRKLPDTAAQAKAQHLGTLAFVRTRFLGDHRQAKTDLEEARRLRPADPYLERLQKENAATARPAEPTP